MLRVLGEGQFGTVKLAQNKKTNKFAAIKILSKHNLIKSK